MDLKVAKTISGEYLVLDSQIVTPFKTPWFFFFFLSIEMHLKAT